MPNKIGLKGNPPAVSVHSGSSMIEKELIEKALYQFAVKMRRV
ncbi:hypothetical protein [Reichenbachiella sp. MALMAid0571]